MNDRLTLEEFIKSEETRLHMFRDAWMADQAKRSPDETGPDRKTPAQWREDLSDFHSYGIW